MDKDTWIVENIAPKNTDLDTRKPRRFVKPVEVFNATRKTKFTLCILGYWAIFMPPYNVARLCSLTRAAGYYTRVFDFNVQTYYDLMEVDPEMKESYRPANYWYWQDQHYYTKVHPLYEPILQKYIDKILEEDTDIIGFSVYYTNILSTKWVIKEIKKRKPNVTIVLGGPECHEGHFEKPEGVDYYFVGESEQNLLDFLENWEKGIKPENEKIGGLYSDLRIDIDSLPYPDYSDFDLTQYWSKNAVCAEISRGCVAKCTYCSEVWYWKFRDRGATTIVDELEHQVKTYGIEFVNFVDSLMNGNLKEFRKFCEELVKRKLGITWWGYARIDGRMDLEFYKLMKAAGCQGFNYGIESGSDKVLVAINKKNTIAEVNQNIIDSEIVGMKVNACWVIGAPGEDIEALTHSFNCLWNHRKRISAVSPGPGLGDNMGSAYDDRAKFNINERENAWLGGWYTLDFTNTKLHRFIRIKLMHIWLELCTAFNGTMVNVHSVGDIKKHYTVTFDDNLINDEIPYENFDYNIINSNLGVFADSSMNEVFGFLRMLWRVKGGFEINIKFNQELDYKDFIFCIYPEYQNYIADINFKIDNEGNFQVKNYYKFENLDKKLIKDKNYEYTYETNGTWKESSKTRLKKIFFIKTENHDRGLLPLESAFASISVAERTALRDHAKLLAPNSVFVEGFSSLGSRASILGHANSKIEIHSFEKFIPHEIMQEFGSMQSWILEQLLDICKWNNAAPEPAHELLKDIMERLQKDPSGRLVWKKLTSRFQNIKLHQVDSIYNLINWNKKVDSCFIKIHNEQEIKESVDFWLKHINPTGTMIFHPYDKDMCPPVYNAVDKLLSTGWKISNLTERLVFLNRS